MTVIIDLRFPGHQTSTATSCIPHSSVYVPGPRAGKCNTWLQNDFKNDFKICEAEVTLTYPGFQRICFFNRFWWFVANPRQRGTKRLEEKIPSGHRSCESHFHAILGSYISPNRFGSDVHVCIDPDSWDLIVRDSASQVNDNRIVQKLT